MELRPTVVQLQVIEGVQQESATIPGVAVRLRPGHAVRARQRDSLFVHLSLTGPPETTRPLLEDLTKLLESNYFRAGGSATAAIRSAINSINERLLRLNLTNPSERRLGALTAAILREDALYMAQVGEGFALFGHRHGVERQPTAKPTLNTPLGSTAGLEIRYTHHRLQPNTTLLLGDPRVAHLDGSQFSGALLNSDQSNADQALTDGLAGESARLLWVRFVDPVETPATAGPPKVFVPLPEQPVRDTGPAPTPHRPTAATDLTTAMPPAEGAEPTVAVAPAAAASADTPQPPTVPPPARQRPPASVSARRATAQSLTGLSRATGWLARFFARFRAADRPNAGRDGGSNETPPSIIATLLAILIPLVVSSIAITIYRENSDRAQIAQIRVDLAEAMTTAQAAERRGDDPRALYLFVIDRAREAAEYAPNDQEVQRQLAVAKTAIDRLDGVARLQGTVLRDFGRDADLRAIAPQLNEANPGIYVLDAADDTLTFLPTSADFTTLTGSPERVLSRNTPVNDYVITDLVDIMWRPRGSELPLDTLGVLGRDGGYITVYPDGTPPRSFRLGLASDWDTPTDIAAYQERLYVLDPPNASIWRYVPTSDTFQADSEYRAITALDDIDAAVDFVIPAEDGSVILIYADGRMRRYANNRIMWDEADLAAKGLDTPLRAPTAVKIAGSGISWSLFVADASQERIVQISRVGGLIAVFKATDSNDNELFGNVSDFAVLQSPLRILALADGQLILAEQAP